MKCKIRRMIGLVLAVILCFCMLPTTAFAYVYYGGTISSDVKESQDTILLNADTTIAEGETFALTLSAYQHIELKDHTLTNYGTITTAYSSNEFDGGTFYNYGVCEITGFYRVTVYDLTLSSIALSSGTLSPSFAAGTREYAVTVDNSVTSIDITPTLNTGTGVKSMTVNGTTATSGAASTVSLDVGENSIPIVITASDGSDTANTYTLTVTRASAADYTITNALFVSAGTLGISQDMLQWSNVDAPGGYKLEIYTESGTRVYSGTLTNNYTPASEVLTSSGTYYFTVYALDAYGNELSSKTSSVFTYSHTHSYEAVVTDPTCTEKGYTTYTCKVCGHSYTADETEATGHRWGGTEYLWSSDMQTCTATRTCENDSSHVEEATATVTGVETKAATCTEYGETTYTAVFSESWAREQTKVVADISAKGHSLTHVETQGATCTANGNSEYWYCSECGKYYSDYAATAEISQSDTVLALTSHSYGSWYSDKQNHWHTCAQCGEIADQEAHGFGAWTVTKEPTATATGLKTRTCTVCGYTQTRRIAATGSDNPKTGGPALSLLLPAAALGGLALLTGKRRGRGKFPKNQD